MALLASNHRWVNGSTGVWKAAKHQYSAATIIAGPEAEFGCFSVLTSFFNEDTYIPPTSTVMA